jgi:hypothetical protein
MSLISQPTKGESLRWPSHRIEGSPPTHYTTIHCIELIKELSSHNLHILLIIAPGPIGPLKFPDLILSSPPLRLLMEIFCVMVFFLKPCYPRSLEPHHLFVIQQFIHMIFDQSDISSVFRWLSLSLF